MLHQPASTFEPSQPAPSTAQPFDAKRYLQRARALGLMVFPTIMPSGRPTFGLTAYPGYSFSDGNHRLAKEFNRELDASSDGSAAVFEALCEDFGLDPADERFNEKINAACRVRSQESTDGDKRLIELCKRAKAALEKDLAATDLFCDCTELYEKSLPPKPTYVTAVTGAQVNERDDAKTMRDVLRDGLSEWSRSATRAYRARIAKVVAYEKECERLSRDVGLTKAKAAADAAERRSNALVTDVAELPATTLLGMALKASLLPLWKKVGYGIIDSTGEHLAYSIADDAEMLGARGPATVAFKSRHPAVSAH